MINSDQEKKWTMRDRVLAVMDGRLPDRLPFIDRIEIWYKGMLARRTMPLAYEGMSLNEVHQAVGIGREKFSIPYALKLNGVEMSILLENELIFRTSDPAVRYFPAQYPPEEIPRDRPGTSVVQYKTPVGSVSVAYVFAESMISLSGMEPYLTSHLIKEEADYRTIEYILEHAEFVPLNAEFKAEEEEVGPHGFVVPCIHRIPFQQALLEYLGEMSLFQALYDDREALDRLIHVLDLQMEDIIERLAETDLPYIEFGDNLDGMMTNPNLFREYCIPQYQKYTDMLHQQGKKAGSHTDGNLKPLVDFLPESGLDVCESFTPQPLTELLFEDAWEKWRNGPLIWGGIPSDLLEERTDQADFEAFVDNLLATVGRNPIIVGVGDMVLDNNRIERVKYIADRIEAHDLRT
ncbi:MAG: uroporphyrinogen decarboxylase family protein [Thermodesulfobacteriota bacterium]